MESKSTDEEEQDAAARVMAAVLDELARHGYEGLRVEAVAHRASVARTTIYRNWKTPAGLVHAAMQQMPGFVYCVPDTGDLRRDMYGIALDFSAFAHSTNGLAVMRLFTAEFEDEEIARLLEEVRDRQNDRAVSCLRRAIARGELPATLDVHMVSELFAAAVFGRTLVNKQRFEGEYIHAFLDIFLDGIRWSPRARAPEAQQVMPGLLDDQGAYVRELATSPLVLELMQWHVSRGRAPLYGKMFGLMVCTTHALCAQDIERGLEISKGSVSRHLQVLREEGMLTHVHEEERATYYMFAQGAWSAQVEHEAASWGELYEVASRHLAQARMSGPVMARLNALCAMSSSVRRALTSPETKGHS